MKTVIYLDVLLLVNFVVAMFLLAGCATLCDGETGALRLIGASVLAATSSLILLFPELPLHVQLLYQAATAACIIRVAFSWRGIRVFLRLCLWYLLLNLLLAGVVTGASMAGADFVQTNNLSCYFAVSPVLLFGCVAGIYLLLRCIMHCFGRPQENAACPLQVDIFGVQIKTAARYDTGFFVQEPVSGRPVLLIYYRAIRSRLPTEWRGYFDAQFAEKQCSFPLPPDGVALRMIECSTVAGQTLLPAFMADFVQLTTKAGKTRHGRCWIVFTGQAPPDGRMPALFGPELLQHLAIARKEPPNEKDDSTFVSSMPAAMEKPVPEPSFPCTSGLCDKPADAAAAAYTRTGKSNFCEARLWGRKCPK